MQATQILIADPSPVKLDEMQHWIAQYCGSPVGINLLQQNVVPFQLVVEYLFDNPNEAINFQIKYK